MIPSNLKKQYLKLYPNMTLSQIMDSIFMFDAYAESQGINLESSNRHKYLRGWLMKDNFIRGENEKKRLHL